MEETIVAWNPLQPLRDDASVRDIFARVLSQRIDTEILSVHFGLPEATDTVRFPSRTITKAEFVDTLVESLVDWAPLGPVEAAKRFWSRFLFDGWRFPGVPAEVRATLGAYFKIKEDVTDLLMFDDLIDPSFIELGTVADIGCGRNKLGRSLLAYSDNGPQIVKQVIGTDINSYEADVLDSRLEFRKQDGAVLPLDDNSVDIVIIKWALHHMTLDDIHSLAAEFRRVLRPGGRVSAVEGLVGDWVGTKPSFEQEQLNSKTWPKGPWSQRRVQLTLDYLKLPATQQIQVLALEDYHGHWLEQEFLWMPLPCNYMSVAQWTELFSEAGLAPDPSSTRVFGMAPIIHWGPPSVRLVFMRQ